MNFELFDEKSWLSRRKALALNLTGSHICVLASRVMHSSRLSIEYVRLFVDISACHSVHIRPHIPMIDAHKISLHKHGRTHTRVDCWLSFAMQYIWVSTSP